MFCTKCGEQLPDDARVCSKCGAEVGNAGKKETGGIDALLSGKMESLFAGQKEEETVMSSSAYDTVFVEPDEQLQGTLGNGYLENILYKKVKKCHALLTDKRIYFQGTFYSGSGKSLTQQKCEKVVDLEDITGTGFLYSKTFGILSAICWIIFPWILAWILAVTNIRIFGIDIGYGSYYYRGYSYPDYDIHVATAALIGDVIVILGLIIKYIKSRKTYFIVEYAGGGIRFNASIIGLSNVRDFQKQIRRAKDRRKQEN